MAQSMVNIIKEALENDVGSGFSQVLFYIYQMYLCKENIKSMTKKLIKVVAFPPLSPSVCILFLFLQLVGFLCPVRN